MSLIRFRSKDDRLVETKERITQVGWTKYTNNVCIDQSVLTSNFGIIF